MLVYTFEFSLPNQMRDQIHSETKMLVRTEQTDVNQDYQAVFFERPEKVLHKNSRHHLFLSSFSLLFFSSHLQVSSVNLIVTSQIFSFLPLGL